MTGREPIQDEEIKEIYTERSIIKDVVGEVLKDEIKKDDIIAWIKRHKVLSSIILCIIVLLGVLYYLFID